MLSDTDGEAYIGAHSCVVEVSIIVNKNAQVGNLRNGASLVKTMDCSAIVELVREEAGTDMNRGSERTESNVRTGRMLCRPRREAERASADDIPVDRDGE